MQCFIETIHTLRWHISDHSGQQIEHLLGIDSVELFVRLPDRENAGVVARIFWLYEGNDRSGGIRKCWPGRQEKLHQFMGAGARLQLAIEWPCAFEDEPIISLQAFSFSSGLACCISTANW